MKLAEILLAAHYRSKNFYQVEHFQQALHELRSGQPLSRWLGESQLQRWTEFLSWQLSRGIDFIYPGHDFYPDLLGRMQEPPILLSYLGSPVWLSQQGLAIVGSRGPSELSLQWMEQNLPSVLARKNIYVVSGGARGIDQKAHSLCLQHEAPTVVMIPSGLGAIYPRQLRSWCDDIIGVGGAIVSEYPFHQSMQKHFFQARNRLIAGFSRATLIIEAGHRSGTLITARQCIDQGRPLWVLPSHPADIHSRGGLDLLYEGANIVRDAVDITSLYDSEIQNLT